MINVPDPDDDIFLIILGTLSLELSEAQPVSGTTFIYFIINCTAMHRPDLINFLYFVFFILVF